MVGPFGFHPKKTMQSRALGLARPLTQLGHTVAIFMPPWHTPEAANQTWQEDGVTVRYVSLRGGVLGITQQLLRETLAWRPDVVHCFKPKAYSGLVGAWLWQFHRRRIRILVDTDDWEGWGGWNDLDPYSPLQKHFFAWQEQWGMSHCHVLTTASRALQTVAWSMGIPQERVLYLPNGAGVQGANDKGQMTNDNLTLLVYSRLFEFDTERLVRVLRGVKTAVSNLSILLVGAGLHETDGKQFRQQLVEADLMGCVVDMGWVDVEKLASVLSKADVGIYLMEDTLLNRTKCPVKLADMLSVGVPVVAENVGQVGEYVVNGRSGLLRQTGDIEGIIADLVHLLTNKQARDTLSTGAIAHITDQFSWETLATQLEKAYLV